MKIVSMLCLIFFAFALPIATITTAFDTRTPDLLDITIHNIESGQYQPTGGDPIDGDLPPGCTTTGANQTSE